MISLRDVVTGFGNRDPLAEVWRRDLRSGGSSAEITGTLPLSFSGRGKPLTDYLISGNTVQNGTPSPEAPVDVLGCGVWDETQQSYKLPLTINGTEYPIYLGQVPTTRRIKKLALTGEEAWTRASDYVYYTGIKDYLRAKKITSMSTHYFGQTNVSNGEIMVEGSCCFYSDPGVDILYLKNTTPYSTEQDFKSYLAEQYASGTPVTIWYVLATTETGIVNEPLMKIGDYADTISFAQAGVTIPTVSGSNVLDMTSPVKPSEVYINGNGIKPTNDPNFENGG